MLESTLRSTSYHVCNRRYERSCKKVFDLDFKVKHQGQVTYFGFSEILDFANVRIDTKIKSVACIQPEI